MFDLVIATVLLVFVAGVRVAYSMRDRSAGGWMSRWRSRNRPALVGKSLVEASYVVTRPIARRLAADGVSANAVTYASLVFGALAAMALASGHFGLGAWFAACSALCDALDGLVARATGSASAAGELLDASSDRYNEFLFLTGLGLYFRTNAWMLALVLLAIHGSFMVSFADTKAESLRTRIPRGWMRRADRATLLIAGAALSAITGALFHSQIAALTPVLAALVIDSVGANASAARRLLRIVSELRRAPGPAFTSSQPPDSSLVEAGE